MFTYKVVRLPKHTIQIDLTIPKDDVVKGANKAFIKLGSELTVEGFRKGKVPDHIAKKHISSEAIYQQFIRDELPALYDHIVKKEGFKPILAPRIELTQAKAGEDWVIKITIAEKPLIELGDYKKNLKLAKETYKKPKIWTPGKDQTEEKKPSPEADRQMLMNTVLSELLKTVTFEISDLVIEAELENRLSLLVDDVRKIGLTTEAYLKSKNMTIDDLKNRYRKEIFETYKLEFILSEIADKEGIKVEKTDLDALFANIKDDKERKTAEENSYMYASILRKQKAIDYLLGL